MTGVISAIKHTAVAKRTTGSASVLPLVKSNAAVDAGTALSLGTGYAACDNTLQKNPDGNVAWTIAAMNALKVGARAETAAMRRGLILRVVGDRLVFAPPLVIGGRNRRYRRAIAARAG